MNPKGNEKREFPKNIRQIGEAGKERRIYLEDYAITYIRQVKGALLLGENVKIRGVRCCFVSGAIEIPEGDFGEETLKTSFEEAEKNFPELSVVGWFLKAEEIPEELNKEDMQIYREHFQGKEAVLVVYNELEKEEGVYLTLDGFLRKQRGYYVYYEKNQKMQDYLVAKNNGKSVEKETVISDQAIQSFRKIIENKKQKKETENKEPIPAKPIAVKPEKAKINTLHFLYTASTFMVLTILVIGVTMINNYDKMKEMEETMAKMTEDLEVSANVWKEKETETEAETKQILIDARTGETELLEGILKESESSSESAESEETSVTESSSETAQTDSMQTQASNVQTKVEEQSIPVHATQATYTIKFGDTLADICNRYYGSTDRIQDICDLNNIEDPNAIMPGQKLVLP